MRSRSAPIGTPPSRHMVLTNVFRWLLLVHAVIHLIRILTQAAKLVRTYHGKLVATPLGRKILNGEQHGPLQALLFHMTDSVCVAFQKRMLSSYFR